MLVSLNCRLEDMQKDLITLESSELTAQRSTLQRYQDRLTDTANGNAAFPNLLLFDCLQQCNWLTWKLWPCAPTRVINYYPQYSNDPELETYLDFCYVKL